MKKLFFALLTVIAFGLVSCSVDSKLDSYEKACKAGDLEKATKIAAGLEGKELTKEQNKRLIDASMDCGKANLSNAMKDMDDMDYDF